MEALQKQEMFLDDLKEYIISQKKDLKEQMKEVRQNDKECEKMKGMYETLVAESKVDLTSSKPKPTKKPAKKSAKKPAKKSTKTRK